MVPSGHAFVLAMYVWLAVILIAAIVLGITKGHARIGWIALALGCMGAALFWGPALFGTV